MSGSCTLPAGQSHAARHGGGFCCSTTSGNQARSVANRMKRGDFMVLSFNVGGTLVLFDVLAFLFCAGAMAL